LCKNGIRGFHENLVALGEQTCQVFNEVKRCATKNAVSRYNTKAGKSVPEATKRKMAENTHKFGLHRTKMCPNPNVLAYSKIP